MIKKGTVPKNIDLFYPAHKRLCAGFICDKIMYTNSVLQIRAYEQKCYEKRNYMAGPGI